MPYRPLRELRGWVDCRHRVTNQLEDILFSSLRLFFHSRWPFRALNAFLCHKVAERLFSQKTQLEWEDHSRWQFVLHPGTVFIPFHWFWVRNVLCSWINYSQNHFLGCSAINLKSFDINEDFFSFEDASKWFPMTGIWINLHKKWFSTRKMNFSLKPKVWSEKIKVFKKKEIFRQPSVPLKTF